MNVGPGSIAIISDKFDLEYKINQYKKELRLKSKNKSLPPMEYNKPSNRGSPFRQKLEAIIEDKGNEAEFLKAIELYE
jgi:hypothetical protein